MIYGFSSTHKEIKNFSGLQNLNIRKTIYVTQSDEWFPQLAFPISPEDKIIEEMEWGDRKVYLFVGGIGIERIWQVKNMLLRQQSLKQNR